MKPESNTQVAKVTNPATFVREKLLSAGDELALVTPQGTDPKRLLHIIAGVIVRNPRLVSCHVRSLLNCAKDCMSLGLEPNTHHGHAYLIPRWNRQIGGDEATLQIGYKGFAYLMWRSAQVRMLGAGMVYENELSDFSIELGTKGEVRHRPAMRDRGKPVGAYAWVDLLHGGTAVDWMPIDEIEGIMRRSESYQRAQGKGNNSPWHTDFGEMAKKTVFKRLQKLLQMPGLVAQAVEVDNRNDPLTETERHVDGRVVATFDDEPEDAAKPEPSMPASAKRPESSAATTLGGVPVFDGPADEPEPAPAARSNPKPKRGSADNDAWEMGV